MLWARKIMALLFRIESYFTAVKSECRMLVCVKREKKKARISEHQFSTLGTFRRKLFICLSCVYPRQSFQKGLHNSFIPSCGNIMADLCCCFAFQWLYDWLCSELTAWLPVGWQVELKYFREEIFLCILYSKCKVTIVIRKSGGKV